METVSHEEDDASPHRRSSTQAIPGKLTIGIDVGDVWSLYCTLWLSLLRIETIQTYASS